MRVALGLAALLLSVFMTAAGVCAKPCDANIAYLVKVPQPGMYAIGFGSDSRTTEDLDVQFYIGDDRYRIALSHVALDGTKKSSAPTYITFPAGAAPVDYAMVQSQEASTGVSDPCTSGYESADSLGSPEPKSRDPLAAQRKIDIANGLAAASLAEPVAASKVASEPKPDCADAYADAHPDVIVEPEYPLTARMLRHMGTSTLIVELDARGNVTSIETHRSSGWPELDEAATRAAAATTYKPEIFRCRPVGGRYIFRAEFVGR